MSAPGQAGRRGDGWIRVEEGLPKIGDQVWCLDSLGDVRPSSGGYEGGDLVSGVARVIAWQPIVPPAPPVADR